MGLFFIKKRGVNCFFCVGGVDKDEFYKIIKREIGFDIKGFEFDGFK